MGHQGGRDEEARFMGFRVLLDYFEMESCRCGVYKRVSCCVSGDGFQFGSDGERS
jgi:hypothetical protein